jgi:hypothetical protein
VDRVKMIWEFRGEESEQFALHHAKHLEEFAIRKKIQNYSSGIESVSTSFSIAYLTVNKEEWEDVAKVLRPHKAYVEKH